MKQIVGFVILCLLFLLCTGGVGIAMHAGFWVGSLIGLIILSLLGIFAFAVYLIFDS